MQVTQLTPSIGSEIQGIDLGQPVSEERAQLLRNMLSERGVLVIRDQQLDRDQHKTCGRLFGELHTHPSRANTQGDPHIFKVRADADTRLNNGGSWHSDLSCSPLPPLASLLLLRDLPAGGGGDTLFANMCDFFAALSPRMQAFLRTLTARHDGKLDLRQYGIPVDRYMDYPCTEHPVVVVHPDTQREILLVNGSFTDCIVELERAESDALLRFLIDKIERAVEFQCRVRWAPHTLVIWDNRMTQHKAVWDYFPHERYGERVSVKSPQRLIKSPQRLIKSPQRLIKSPQRLEKSPQRPVKSPQSVKESPQRQTDRQIESP